MRKGWNDAPDQGQRQTGLPGAALTGAGAHGEGGAQGQPALASRCQRLPAACAVGGRTAGPGGGRGSWAKPELRSRPQRSLPPGHAHLWADTEAAVASLLRPGRTGVLTDVRSPSLFPLLPPPCILKTEVNIPTNSLLRGRKGRWRRKRRLQGRFLCAELMHPGQHPSGTPITHCGHLLSHLPLPVSSS